VTSERRQLDDADATEAAGAALARRLGPGMLVLLRGPLGAGKTTLVRGILRQFGYRGSVKSPTYTLLEPYDLPDQQVLHFDLYRIADPAELEFIGFDELLEGPALKLVEWPERAAGRLPAPDLELTLALTDRGRRRLLELEWH